MPFCTKCGTQLESGNKFCYKCGAPVDAMPQQVVPVNPAPIYGLGRINLPVHAGVEQVLPFWGKIYRVSPQIDVFNYYRKEFRTLARIQVDALRREYCARITDLDSFLTVFPELYFKYRKPLIDAAVDIFPQVGVYDLSPEQFEEQHTADFCLCGEDVDIIIDSFNATIEANQESKVRMYNMMPGMVFHGIGGFAAALAVNVAVNKIAEADIRNADVSKKQRAELYSRIDFECLMERAFLDFWRVFLSLTWWMNQKGLPVWYPNEQDNQRASGLFQNLEAGRIPPQMVVEQIVVLLQLNPYVEGHLQHVYYRFGVTEETKRIFEYFGFEG